MPGVDRDRTKLHHIEQRGEITPDDFVLRGHSLVGNRFHPHAVRDVLRRALLIERFALHAVREAFHYERPIGDGRQNVGRHVRIVAQEVTLGRLCGWEKDFREVRYLEGRGWQIELAAFGVAVLELLEYAD